PPHLAPSAARRLAAGFDGLSQALPDRRRQRMAAAQRAFAVGERRLVRRHRVIETPDGLVRAGEAVPSPQRVRMFATEFPLTVHERLLVLHNGLPQFARALLRMGEAVPDPQRRWMIATQDPLGVDSEALEERARLVNTAG